MAKLHRVVKEVTQRGKTYMIRTREEWPEIRPLTVYWWGQLSNPPPEYTLERSDWVMGRGEYHDVVWEDPDSPQEPDNPRLLWDLLMEEG